MRYLKILIIALIASFSAQAVYHKPYLKNVLNKEYGSSKQNWNIAQDECGVMYFGNEWGLLECNGLGWKINSEEDARIIHALAVKNHDIIYTGGFESIGYWKRDVTGILKYVSLKDKLRNASVVNENLWKAYIDGNKVYYQSFGSIFVYDGKEVTQIKSDNGLMPLIKARNTYFTQSVNGVLLNFNGKRLEKVPGSEIFNGTSVLCVVPYGKSDYMICTSESKTYIYDGKTITPWNVQMNGMMNGKIVNCGVYSKHNNTYFIGTQLDGLYEFDTNGVLLNHFNLNNQLQNNTVLSLYEDAKGVIWVGMDNGLTYVRYDEDMSYFMSNNSSNVGTLYDAAFFNGNIFIATNQGVYYSDSKNLNNSDFFNTLQLLNKTQGQVWHLSKDGDRLYCCHNLGLLEVSPTLAVTSPLYLDTGVFNMIKIDIDGKELYVIVTYKNVAIWDRESGKVSHINDIKDQIINVEVDHLNNIWLQTSNKGVYRCKIDIKDNLKTKGVKYYGHENDNTLPRKLTVCRIGGRIFFVGNDRFWSYNEESNNLKPADKVNECLSQVTNIQRVIPIGSEYCWVVTSDALYRFFYDGYVAKITYSHSLYESNSALTKQCENISVLSGWYSFACYNTNFILIDGNREQKSAAKLNKPFLESVLLMSNERDSLYINYKTDKKVDYEHNNVIFRISSGNSYADALQVEYKLEGGSIKDEWTMLTGGDELIYERLPRGKYTLYVRASDGTGNYSENLEYTFTVLPPWYRSIVAYIMYVVLAVLVIFGIWMFIRRRYKNKNQRHIQRLEAEYLKRMNERLVSEIEDKNAEMFTQTSFIIRKNELIMKMKEIIDTFIEKKNMSSLVPLSSKINTLISNDFNSEEDWQLFLIKFEQKYKNYFKHLKEKYPQLTNNDLRLCACLKLNLSTKDIASLMNLTVRAVENNRYRLRKKINLEAAINLNDHFMGID